MIPSSIAVFELRQGPADGSLVALSKVSLALLSREESSNVYLRVRDAAEKGNAFAMCLCATWPDVHGQGKPTNDEHYMWAERAADASYPPGIFELGLCLERGIGTSMDLARALQLYKRSSEAGFGLASHRLGTGYMDGEFGAVDAKTAVRFMELAYQQGEALGAFELGRWLESGEKLPPDLSASARWYERSSEMGNFFATLRLQLAYARGELGLPRDASIAKRYEARLSEQTEVEKQNPTQSSD